MPDPRRKRPQGEASRQRILDAAAEIAGERGYEGTSINRVSERSGLPASSIYWHFKDKDELIAAVIDRSFAGWLAMIRSGLGDLPIGRAPADEVIRGSARASAAAFSKFSDFLRLGMLLILEHRPEDPTARRRFIEVRNEAAAGARSLYAAVFPDLDAAAVDTLALLALALADGMFVAVDLGEVEMDDAFDLVATALLGAAARLGAAGV